MEHATAVNEAAIWVRIVQPMSQKLPPEAAKFFLALGFADSDIQKMHELTTRQQEGGLSGEELESLRRYRMVGLQMDLLRSISRRSLAIE
ncbi:MAG: hypothetical protein ABL921_08735 [Pirellula sp.]